MSLEQVIETQDESRQAWVEEVLADLKLIEGEAIRHSNEFPNDAWLRVTRIGIRAGRMIGKLEASLDR